MSNGTELKPSEALYMFAGWLTCREHAVTMGSEHNAAQAAELVAQFCAHYGLEPPRDDFAKLWGPHPPETRLTNDEGQNPTIDLGHGYGPLG